LADYLRKNRQLLANSPKVLDLGCGSGILALTAAKLGGKVIATDLNPAAVRCTKLNAEINQLTGNLEVRFGATYDPVAVEKFDLILCNPPYFAKEPETELERAFFAGTNQSILRAILLGLAGHLSPGGHALLVVSDQIGFERLLPQLDLGGLSWQVAARKRWWGEQQVIYDLVVGG
jgi:HemK-related putative methylase